MTDNVNDASGGSTAGTSRRSTIGINGANVHDQLTGILDNSSGLDSILFRRIMSDEMRSITIDNCPSPSASADLLVSLFMAALSNYRRDSVLRPFPSSFLQAAKDFKKLKSVADLIPSLSSLLQHLPSLSNPLTPRDVEAICLLDWILNTKNFFLEIIPVSTFSEIIQRTGQIVDAPCPNYIFEVHHHARYCATTDAIFESDVDNLIYAYHGSRLENFHSILHNGLRNHLNKNSAFGEGTYLSSELSVCLAYSPTGSGWRKSIFGDKLSCVAVCQIIRHPDVKCHTRRHTDAKINSSARSSVLATDSIPEKYYLVQNDELVRIKYLLVYSERSTNEIERNQMTSSPEQRGRLFGSDRFLLTMLAYIVVLLVIGLSNSSSFRAAYRRFL